MCNSLKTKVPCYNCKKRSLGCHGTCEEYKTYSLKRNNINDKRHEEHVKRDLIDDFEYEIRNKAIKKHRRR